MSPDQRRRSPFDNIGEPADAQSAGRAELDNPHGEIARFPEAEAELDEPHVGEVRGPVIGEKGDVRPDDHRAADALIGFKRPPVKPREIQ